MLAHGGSETKLGTSIDLPSRDRKEADLDGV